MPGELSKLVRGVISTQWRPVLRQPYRKHLARAISIQQTPASNSPTLESGEPTIHDLDSPTSAPSSTTPDARFEVLGSTSSLLSVALSASQNLYTRRGTLVGVSGSPENAASSLSPLSPILRLPTGIPFLYQRVSSTTPLNLMIATRSPLTSLSVLHLDGRVDWNIAQRNGLVAWTGHTLSVKPNVNVRMSLAHWGNALVTGRGLVALAASGNTYQVTLRSEETYVAHPSNILAYTINQFPPQPYRFKSSTLRLQLPSLSAYFSGSRFLQTMRTTSTYRFLASALHTIQTWTRRTIWGDRLFLRFQGPTTILLQSRGSRIRDVLTQRDANEIADAPAGVSQPQPRMSDRRDASGVPRRADDVHVGGGQQATPTKLSYASIGNRGEVRFGKTQPEDVK